MIIKKNNNKQTIPFFTFLLFFSFFFCQSTVFGQPNLHSSIVKIFVVSSSFNYYNPWQMQGQSTGTGSGCIIAGNRILTNAHVISNQTYIEVKRAGIAKRFVAYPEFISHASDLAILKVKDIRFFQNSKPIPLGELPFIRDRVSVYGFPAGGNELSITEGVVSRIEHRYYAHSNSYLLTTQIDAAINAGNSGGPVIKDGKIIGVAFQSYRNGDNIGYMVPAPIIQHFLTDISDGKLHGFPALGLSMQKMENQALKQKFLMPVDKTGILIRKISFGSPAQGKLFPDDIILSIDSQNIADDGTIEFRPEERTYFGHLIQQKQIGQSLSIQILRRGKKRTIPITLTHPLNSLELVPYDQYEKPPTYFVYGGLLFMPLSKDLLKEWGKTWIHSAPKKLLYHYMYGSRTADQLEVVVLVKVLADELNMGYHNLGNLVITKVNNKPIRSIRDVIHALKNHTGMYHEILDDQNNIIILNRAQAERANLEILKKYKIPTDRSSDLRNQ